VAHFNESMGEVGYRGITSEHGEACWLALAKGMAKAVGTTS
jgi:hypothetical protein